MNRRFDQAAVKPVQPLKMTELPPGMNIERRTPIHPPTVQAQVVVPVARAIVTGALFLFLGWLLAYNWHWPKVVPFAAFLFGFAVVWFWKGLRDDLCYLVETATGRDINQDGDVGRPVPGFVIEQVERKQTGGSQWVIVDARGKTEDFARFAFAALTGKSIAMDAWCGGAHPWSRAEYIHNREECIRLKWLAWRDERNHNLGLDVTEEGEVGFGQWLEQHASARAYAGGTPQALRSPGVGESARQIEHMEQE